MRVLVTGQSGFIGIHLTKALWSANHKVVGADIAHSDLNTVGHYGESVPPRRVCHQVDVGDAEKFRALLDRRKPDVVIHLAAKVGRLFGEDDVQRTIADNVGMTANVAQACGERGIRLMYASTSEVYGDQGDYYCREDLPFTKIPHNAYGLSKRQGEEFCRLYASTGLSIMRFSMPYGSGLPAGRGRAALINFLYSALHLEPITVHRGSERSWCWIGDTVRAVRLLLEGTSGGTYNIGRDDNALPMREVAEMCCDLTGAPYDLITEVDPPARQTVVKRLSTTKIRKLGWTPEVSLEEGMERTLAYVAERYPVAVAA